MTKQKNIMLSGRVANVIFYEFRGIPCSRAMPAKVRQSKATKASAKQFGKASRLSKLLRSELVSVLPDPKDKKMMYRLNTALLQWLKTTGPDNSGLITRLPFIEGFQFNEATSITERLRLPLTTDWVEPGKVMLNIPQLVPAKDIAVPAGTKTVSWQIAVASCKVNSLPAITGNYVTAIDMTYNNDNLGAEKIELPISLKPGEIAVVALGLKYTVIKKNLPMVITDKRWQPADIIGAFFMNSK
jgi:hypothetical protein